MKVPTVFVARIPKERKAYIKNCMKTFDKSFSNSSANLFAVSRNKIGVPLHFGTVLCGIMKSISDILHCDMEGFVDDAILTKLNFDFVQYINNINKRKAAAFFQYMKKNDINDEKELTYAIGKYLIKSGSYHYPLLHPSKIKQMAKTGDYTRSFETGIIYVRTDKKDLLHRLNKKMSV